MTNSVPEGWYPDPRGLAEERFFDGSDWTDLTRETKSGASGGPAPSRPVGPTDGLLAAQLATAGYTRAVALGVLLVLWNGIGVALLVTFGATDAGPLVWVAMIAVSLVLVWAISNAFWEASRFHRQGRDASQ